MDKRFGQISTYTIMLFLLFSFLYGYTKAAPAKDPEAVADVMAGRRQEANAAWWGFDPEDATQYLQAAIDSGVARLIIPNMGHDWIVRPIILRSNMELIFEDGVVVTAKKGEYRGRNDSVFTARDIDNVSMIGYGATIRMQKEDYMTSPYEKAEWRMGINLRGVKNVRILGFTIRDTGGDGIYLGRGSRVYNEDVTIKDVVLDNNYRQGISVISAKNLLIEDSVFKNTGGTAPMAGIDLEPNNPDEKLENIVVRNSVFENNEGHGIHMYLKHLDSRTEISVLWENILIRGNTIGYNINLGDDSDQPHGHITIRNCVIEGTLQNGIAVRFKDDPSLKIAVENCVVHDVADQSPVRMDNLRTAIPIVLEARHQVSNIEFRDMTVIDDKDRPVLYGRVIDESEKPAFMNITGNIQVVNPFGAQVKWDGPREGVSLAANSLSAVTIDYGDVVSLVDDASVEVSTRPAIRFANLSWMLPPTIVQGIVSPGIELLGFEENDVEEVEVFLADTSIYRGSLSSLDDFILDTTAIQDGHHDLTVTARGNKAGVVRATVGFTTRNFAFLVDAFEGPKEVAWFGTVYQPKTIDQSDGWVYVTDRPGDFFRDPTRKRRKDNTTEYLMWETPRLKSVKLDLYAQDVTIEDVVSIEVSADGSTWETFHYAVDMEGPSATGWHKLSLNGAVIGRETHYTRVIFRETATPLEVQLGQAIFQLLRD